MKPPNILKIWSILNSKWNAESYTKGIYWIPWYFCPTVQVRSRPSIIAQFIFAAISITVEESVN
jgi:hypothetical protein